MAVRETRLEPTTVERIQRHRKPRKSAPPSRELLAAVRTVVRESDSTDGAIAAVEGIISAWKHISPATRDAVDLLVTILKLSDTTDDALMTFGLLDSDGSLLKPLTEIQAFVQSELPGASMRIVPGDEVSSAYLDVLVPTKDYPTFWEAHLRLRDWVIAHLPDLLGTIHVTPLPARANV